MTMPMTYESESANRRERRPSLCMAKKPIVIGIIGKTHGVRLSAMPSTKRTTSVSGIPLRAKVVATAPCGGAAASGTKSFPVEDRRLACPFVTPTGEGACPPLDENSPLTFFGGKQTLSLQAW